jgi:hypothetical protein
MKINSSGRPAINSYFLDRLDLFFFVLRFPPPLAAAFAITLATFTKVVPTPFPTLPKVFSPEAALFWSTVVLSSNTAGLHVGDASIEATVVVISGSHLYFLSPVFAKYPTQLPVQDGLHSPVLLQQYVLPPPLIFLRPVRARFAVLRAIYKI